VPKLAVGALVNGEAVGVLEPNGEAVGVLEPNAEVGGVVAGVAVGVALAANGEVPGVAVGVALAANGEGVPGGLAPNGDGEAGF
jgi:hypothetical protein